ncbi:hypothetical protein [Cellulomonas dongxiuzhuiae]|uniref:hypothetical protein n=1 Tax=Cellulomonas dongxiuzhuiae TaxID=2819979 RepID=UPI001AAF25F6|nr:hypothetical protein [Cellulomonas dongxiuzhuiae]MBO3090042.1 hypothetical protein [Cellulomonas dongxiuzhuiae]
MSDDLPTTSTPDAPLTALDADRAALARRARRPAWLAPALGAVTATWVTTSLTPRPDGTSPSFFLFVVAMLLVLTATRSTGVRLRTVGARGWAAYLGLVVVGLLLYSTALALVSLGLDWWVAVPTVLMFGATVAGVRAVDDAGRRALHRGR